MFTGCLLSRFVVPDCLLSEFRAVLGDGQRVPVRVRTAHYYCTTVLMYYCTVIYLPVLLYHTTLSILILLYLKLLHLFLHSNIVLIVLRTLLICLHIRCLLCCVLQCTGIVLHLELVCSSASCVKRRLSRWYIFFGGGWGGSRKGGIPLCFIAKKGVQ